MEILMNKAVTPYMIKVLSPLPAGTTLYEIMLLQKEAAETLYRQAYSDGWKQRDADKIMENMESE